MVSPGFRKMKHFLQPAIEGIVMFLLSRIQKLALGHEVLVLLLTLVETRRSGRPLVSPGIALRRQAVTWELDSVSGGKDSRR
jgi:hypothetical protein